MLQGRSNGRVFSDLDKSWQPSLNCLLSHALFVLLPVKYPVSVHVDKKADYSNWMLLK